MLKIVARYGRPSAVADSVEHTLSDWGQVTARNLDSTLEVETWHAGTSPDRLARAAALPNRAMRHACGIRVPSFATHVAGLIGLPGLACRRPRRKFGCTVQPASDCRRIASPEPARQCSERVDEPDHSATAENREAQYSYKTHDARCAADIFRTPSEICICRMQFSYIYDHRNRAKLPPGGTAKALYASHHKS